jgi:hypothetical protein
VGHVEISSPGLIGRKLGFYERLKSSILQRGKPNGNAVGETGADRFRCVKKANGRVHFQLIHRLID